MKECFFLSKRPIDFIYGSKNSGKKELVIGGPLFLAFVVWVRKAQEFVPS